MENLRKIHLRKILVNGTLWRILALASLRWSEEFLENQECRAVLWVRLSTKSSTAVPWQSLRLQRWNFSEAKVCDGVTGLTSLLGYIRGVKSSFYCFLGLHKCGLWLIQMMVSAKRKLLLAPPPWGLPTPKGECSSRDKAENKQANLLQNNHIYTMYLPRQRQVGPH